jgi:hypothetical protein
VRLPEEWRRRYARAMGYFWIPCPHCGEYFGGQEPTGGSMLGEDSFFSGTAWATCVNCPGYYNEQGQPISSESFHWMLPQFRRHWQEIFA